VLDEWRATGRLKLNSALDNEDIDAATTIVSATENQQTTANASDDKQVNCKVLFIPLRTQQATLEISFYRQLMLT